MEYLQSISLILTVINSIILISIVIVWFNNNYIIKDIETWNTIANFYNKHRDEYDENDKPIVEEKAGGFGFMCYTNCEDDEDYEDKSKKK